MPDTTPKPTEQDDAAKTNGAQDIQELEEAQKEAAKEREDEGGYQ